MVSKSAREENPIETVAFIGIRVADFRNVYDEKNRNHP
jgi:hypothetical protein